MTRLLPLFFLLTSFAVAQQGKVYSTETVSSKILNREINYSIYLPPSYDTSEKHYPIVYLLHGAWDDYLGWVQWGNLQSIADKIFQEKTVPEMIIVMPDGLVDSFYQNSFDGKIRYEDFFFQEFIPQIEEQFRVTTKVQPADSSPSRAIAGQSMGGYGALYLCLKQPQLFKAVYTSSAGFIDIPRIYSKPFDKQLLDDTFSKIWGKKTTTGSFENFRKNSIQKMVSDLIPLEVDRLPPILIECGDDDYLLDGNIEVAQILQKKKAKIEFRVYDGGHTTDYWRDKVDDILLFIGEKF
ncbi:MAG: alpha/beta hydrolase [Flavobacteriaceae bacterium]